MRGISAILLLIMPCVMAAQSTSVGKANKLYKEGKFEKAIVLYQQSLKKNNGDMVSNYNMANAYFRDNKFEEAAKTYNLPLAENNTADMRQRAFYNKGVALSKQKKLEESIDAYKQAVLLNPADEDARINLQKALLELKKKQPPKEENKNDNKKQQKKDNDKQNQPPKSNMSKKEVEQKLKALQQREQQVQRKMQQNRTGAGTQQEKDW